jgi:hypothetical protein
MMAILIVLLAGIFSYLFMIREEYAPKVQGTLVSESWART